MLKDRKKLLEIGSGTGQHAACFAPELPHLAWQASDVAANLPGIREWGVVPIELDVDAEWPAIDADAVFSANTCHIMSWPQVERMFAGIGRIAGRHAILFAARRRDPGLLVFVIRVARRAASLLHLVFDHCNDRVIGDAALARTIVVQNVTEPKPALLHELPRSRSFSGGIV